MTASDAAVVMYVDGFNLYYGLKSKKWQRYYWLDLRSLGEGLLLPGQKLTTVRYFTARILPESDDPDKAVRQNTFLEALGTLTDVRIHYGKYSRHTKRCPNCGTATRIEKEKMTDVNIAVALLGDAQDDLFGTAILVSGDSDLTGPVREVRRRYPGKRVVVAFPPERVSKQLRTVATAYFTIGRGVLASSQLPNPVKRADGQILKRPSTWR